MSCIYTKPFKMVFKNTKVSTKLEVCDFHHMGSNRKLGCLNILLANCFCKKTFAFFIASF